MTTRREFLGSSAAALALVTRPEPVEQAPAPALPPSIQALTSMKSQAQAKTSPSLEQPFA